MFEDEFGEIFDDEDGGRTAKGMNDILMHLTELIIEKEMPISMALEGLLNILKPGTTKASHDVIQQFRVAMFVQGHGEVAEHISAVWLTEFPWGIGFHFGFDDDYRKEEMSFETKRAVIRGLCAVLQGGGIKAEMTDNDRIRVTRDNGDEQDIDIDSVVDQFRDELDKELGPDAEIDRITPDEGRDITDWMRRWMPE